VLFVAQEQQPPLRSGYETRKDKSLDSLYCGLCGYLSAKCGCVNYECPNPYAS